MTNGQTGAKVQEQGQIRGADMAPREHKPRQKPTRRKVDETVAQRARGHTVSSQHPGLIALVQILARAQARVGISKEASHDD